MMDFSTVAATTLALDALDVAVLAVTMLGIAAFGLYMGRREEGVGDFFLAGRSVSWWAVAGSILGSNVSSHHLIGMMGAGLAIGFAQSNFEYGAIFGLMVLCFFFLPLYRRMGLYTLSEYLGRRYDDRSRLLYALTNMGFVTIQMCGALILGAITINALTAGTQYEISYAVAIRGLALFAAAYTLFGGLKAVIYTDVLQSILLFGGAAVIAVLAITHENVGGLASLMNKDADRFRLFLPADHEKLPWTGVLTGLMVLHFNYWATNQYMVQRALGAKSGWDARVGIISAGFFKLLIPFICIVPGMAAAFILDLDPTKEADAAFAGLTRELIRPGYGLLGLVMAGLVGAILSTIDSMMNSTATLFTFDIYRRYINPHASERRLIWVGRGAMAAVVVLAIRVSLSFGETRSGVFLTMVDYESYLVPGVLVAFMAGIFHRFVTPTAAVACICIGPLASLGVDLGWPKAFGGDIQTFHRVAIVTAICYAALLAVSSRTQSERSPDREQYLWARYRRDPADAADHRKSDRVLAAILVALTLGLCWYFA
ncbi:MAG: sodium/solute symporter [Pirellulales bacterium]